MMRALLFLVLLATVTVSSPAIAAVQKEPVCVQAGAIENWRVSTRRAISIDVRTPDNQATLIVTFLRDCFSGWPFKAMRIDAQGACLAPGDSMIFNFPPSEDETQKVCVVKMIKPPPPPQAVEQPACEWQRERCY